MKKTGLLLVGLLLFAAVGKTNANVYPQMFLGVTDLIKTKTIPIIFNLLPRPKKHISPTPSLSDQIQLHRLVLSQA